MKKAKKKFDAVDFQRKVRAELSKKYFDNPDLFEKDMERVREKYGMMTSKKYKMPSSNSSVAAEPKTKYKKKK